MTSSTSASSTIALTNLPSSTASTAVPALSSTTSTNHAGPATAPNLTTSASHSTVAFATPPATPTTTSATTSQSASSATSTSSQSRQWPAEAKRLCGTLNPWMLFLTIVALAIAVFGIVPMLKGLALARWTAIKDYREHCAELEGSRRQVIDASCKKALDKPLPPPPLRPRYFEADEVEFYSSQGSSMLPADGQSVESLTPSSQYMFFCLVVLCAVALVVHRYYPWLSMKTLRRPIQQRGPLYNHDEVPNQIPLSIPRLETYSTAVGHMDDDSGLFRHREPSQQHKHAVTEFEGEWEPNRLSRGFKRHDTRFEAVSESNDQVDVDMNPVPNSDPDCSDGESIYGSKSLLDESHSFGISKTDLEREKEAILRRLAAFGIIKTDPIPDQEPILRGPDPFLKRDTQAGPSLYRPKRDYPSYKGWFSKYPQKVREPTSPSNRGIRAAGAPRPPLRERVLQALRQVGG